MKKLDRFILKSFLGPFVATLLVVVFILMMQFLWLYIDELVGKGLSLRIILEFLMWGICTILPLALPLTTLLASVMTVGAMGEHNELLAMKSAGIPITRILVPISICAVLIGVGAFFIGNNLVPKAYDEIYTLRDDIGKTKDEIKIPSGTFYEGIEGYILRIDEQDDNGMMHQVMVYDHTARKGNTNLTIADSAIMKLSAGKDYLTFTLFDGSTYQENNRMYYRDTILNLQRLDFARQELVIPLSNYSFEKSDSTRFSDQFKSMKLSQLSKNHDSLTVMAVQNRKNNYQLFKAAGVFERRAQLDTARRQEARPAFRDSSFLKFTSPEDELEAYKEVLDKVEMMRGDASTYDINSYEAYFSLRHVDVELLKKFAQALACLLMFLIGAPLGALISRGGLGTSAIVSILFFVLYWVIDISGTKLANEGATAASIGVFISSAVLLPIGLFLTWKASHDSTIGQGSFKAWRKMLASRISRFFRPVRIVYMGTPEFAVAPLEALRKAGYKVVGVVTVADKPSGRGLKVNESAVKKYAVENGLPVLQPVKLKDPEFLKALAEWKADLFVVVAFRMLPEEVWSMPRLGTFNLHAALLPQYRGAAPINWAVINGEKHTGVTTFFIDKDIDTGNILLRQECPIGPNDTAGIVHDNLMTIGSDLVVQTVEGIIQHNLEPRVQKEFIQGEETLKPAPKITPETCRIDWTRSAQEVHNLVRGLSPYPTAWTEISTEGGERQMLKIIDGRVSERSGKPGEILSDGKSYLAIACGEGSLDIRELQLAGKKRMDAKSFLAGFREPTKYEAL